MKHYLGCEKERLLKKESRIARTDNTRLINLAQGSEETHQYGIRDERRNSSYFFSLLCGW